MLLGALIYDTLGIRRTHSRLNPPRAQIKSGLQWHIYITYAFEVLAYICCFKKSVVSWNIYKNMSWMSEYFQVSAGETCSIYMKFMKFYFWDNWIIFICQIYLLSTCISEYKSYSTVQTTSDSSIWLDCKVIPAYELMLSVHLFVFPSVRLTSTFWLTFVFKFWKLLCNPALQSLAVPCWYWCRNSEIESTRWNFQISSEL